MVQLIHSEVLLPSGLVPHCFLTLLLASTEYRNGGVNIRGLEIVRYNNNLGVGTNGGCLEKLKIVICLAKLVSYVLM